MDGKLVITGSIAYDHVMNYFGSFEETFKTLDLKFLSFSFLAMNREVFFGGCAGNICFNLNLLGIESTILGGVGTDFDRYRQWLNSINVDTNYLEFSQKCLTASAFMLSDNAENQIGFFSPEAMAEFTGVSKISAILENHSIKLVHIGPGFPARMKVYVEDCHKFGLQYIYDPGQQATLALSPEELRAGIGGARLLISNHIEIAAICRQLECNEDDLAMMVPSMIVTYGEKGAALYDQGEKYLIEAVKPNEVVDTIGSGDAFRAGVIKALLSNDSLLEGCNLGACLAAINIEHRGTQTHEVSLNQIIQKMIQ